MEDQKIVQYVATEESNDEKLSINVKHAKENLDYTPINASKNTILKNTTDNCRRFC